MAEKLARMYGTEEDKVNCPFYFKIGACRYGDKCLRIHNKPPYSQTICIRQMYKNSLIEVALASGNQVSEEDAKQALKHFEEFYQEVFEELANYGELEELIVCDNIGDHLLGTVYAKYVYEEDAMKCMEAIKNRYYDGRMLQPEYSPVTDFSNSKCKQFIEGSCKRGGYCNYMHLKPISAKFKRELYRNMYEDHPEYRKPRRRSRSRSQKKDKKKKHKKHRSSRSRSHKKDKKHKRRRSKSSIRSDMNSEERRAVIARWQEEDEKYELEQQQKNGIVPQQQEQPPVQSKGLDMALLQQQQALIEKQLQEQLAKQGQTGQLQQQTSQFNPQGMPALQIGNLGAPSLQIGNPPK